MMISWKKQDNRGFSLVEIIIVVTIMAVLTGTLGYGISLTSGKPAEECAQKLVSELQHARTTTMGKYKVEIEIKNNDGLIEVTQRIYNTQADYPGAPTITTSTVGARGVQLKYSTEDKADTDYTVLNKGESVSLEFSRSTGGLKNADTTNRYFIISKASSVRKIVIVPLTGRVELCQ